MGKLCSRRTTQNLKSQTNILGTFLEKIKSGTGRAWKGYVTNGDAWFCHQSREGRSILCKISPKIKFKRVFFGKLKLVAGAVNCLERSFFTAHFFNLSEMTNVCANPGLMPLKAAGVGVNLKRLGIP